MRPNHTKSTQRLALRLEPELARRLRRHWLSLRGSVPGHTVTLSDAVRGLLEAGLERAEAPDARKGAA